MPKVHTISKQSHDVIDVPLQSTSEEIWRQKYCLTDQDGNPVDGSIDATFKRTAKAIATVEESTELKEKWYQNFLWALRQGAIPAGRILSNAGARAYKTDTSTINCTVSGTLTDSMEGILGKNMEAGLTLKAGCGIGYEFSTLRPAGATVSGAGARTSGPLSFMEIFDKTCLTVSSAGGRRGAQMATFDVSHPDVLSFIKAKQEDGRLRQFNMSLLISDEFMKAVKDDQPWPLVFPVKADNLEEANEKVGKNGIHWQRWPSNDGYFINKAGQAACKIYKIVSAKHIWDTIMSLTYDYAEPGFILIDRVNDMNNNWFCESIRATNPCGEQPLPEYGSCLLGSINLSRFVEAPFTENALFNWRRFSQVIAIFTRMLDNVVEINGLPLSRQRDEIFSKRRHGMGFLGLGSALTMLGQKYGSKEAAKFTEQVARELAVTGWRAGLELAAEKGMAPALEKEYTVTAEMLASRPEMAEQNIKIGDKLPGRVLHARYSRYMQKLAEVEPGLVEELAEKGSRFTHHTSIAPTGTIALSLGNNVSNGIEPSFAHQYVRNVIREGKKTKEKVDVLSYELLAYQHLINPRATATAEAPEHQLPDYFITTDDISPQQHVDMQAAAQKWVDSSISKTINIPTDMDYDSFKDIYWYAYENGLKGCTTFRFNPEAFQGVLVREDDIANTVYCFTLADATKVELRGNEEIEYDGEIHTAANLYDALKEGYYGRL
ncbi:MAG: adenosylcobalamin-dependent ribonucleoside-diphosphate reductase [Halieaceae bacterium]|jgi:ribonucleoside-diphosphate reductase alpha chain|nr:adenosylcobalamin-dependent ribonucleoside-diphosphate reductase [Halieaceae bacterium]